MEVKPNPSELSYLLYYLSTRRSKLTKVGAFLTKRVSKDVWRRRLGNVQVALHILTALIEKCPRDLPIYASFVLTVIETVLRSNDISMVEDSVATFETFCQHQDIAVISAEQTLAHQYREVVRSYASFADPSSATYSPTKVSLPVAIRWRNAGLRALKGVVSSESLAADGGTSLQLILPVILENLYSDKEDVLVPLKDMLRESERLESEGARPRRMSVTTVHTVDTVEGDPTLAAQSTADADKKAEMDARLLALRCLEKVIISGSNRGQIRVAATVALQFIASKKFPQITRDPSSTGKDGGNWATSLIELIANWCPVQVRFVILVAAMDTLHEMKPTEDALPSSYTILSVVDWLLKSSVNMIGLSVMDILFGLIRYISAVLSTPSQANGADQEKPGESQGDDGIFISPERRSLLILLEHCIGDLATHIYYGDQVADMMRAILRRFKPTANVDSAAQSSLATVHEAGATPAAETTQTAEVNGEKPHSEGFTYAAAKVTALRAVKSIMIVSTLRTPSTAGGSEARNQVGIHVWEGTQGLLRDPDQQVRRAYADAFLTWLALETNKRDLKVRVDIPKYIKPTSKRDSEQPDKLNRRSTSAPGNQRDKVALVAQSTFLRLLHLAIYDAALENPTVESEILLLHLLLTSLVENLGVNAAQYGLPMTLKLQEDLFTSVDLGSSTARVNIGSLVHGYLLAIVEKFNLDSTHAGVEIRNEIQKRQSKSQYFSKIRLPPTGLDGISVDDDKSVNDESVPSTTLTPFRNVDDLVNGMDEAYRQSISSPPQSPPASAPARGFSFPVLNHASVAAQSQPDSGLPSPVKEQMLSSWSRESCLAAVEKESIKTLSINGSRGGTMTRTSQGNGVANGSPAGSASNKHRRMSVPEISRTPEPSSTRGSPVRVTELRRVLSVHHDSEPRKLSPLRGQVGASNESVVSSGSESMVSASFSVSEVDGEGAFGQQDGEQTPEEDGIETPRASASEIALAGEKPSRDNNVPSLSRVNSDEEIPPVPPIPASLSIPGGFPNDSQRSLVSVDRPSTAPGVSRQSSMQGKTDAEQNSRNAHLNRNKSRSNNNLAAGISEVFRGADTNGTDALDYAQRDHLRRILDGYLSPDGSILANGDRPATAVPASKSMVGSYNSRRQVSGGLGRPPY